MSEGKGKVFVFVGRRKSGKTTNAKKLANKINLPKHVSDIQGDWEVDYIDPMDLLDMCIEDENAVYVFGDTTAIIPSGVLTKKFRTAIARSRKKGIILIFEFHSCDMIPNDMFVMGIDGLFILHTNDDPDQMRKQWKNFPHVYAAWERQQKKTGIARFIPEYIKEP